MANLQSIQNALKEMNPAVFQELCDSLLIRVNKNYSSFFKSGSQYGKQKTTVGTPDMFLTLEDGRFIYVEHSTDVTQGVGKLKKDVLKCLDTKKTGVSLEKIAEIIICINFSLKAEEVSQLMDLVSQSGIQLTILGPDSLSVELYTRHVDLAHKYLKIALDTGQIVSIEEYCEEYDRASKGMSAPLNNIFLYRKDELQNFIEALEINDFVVLSGAPGVGKTKLAIEGIQTYLRSNQHYDAFCISNKGDISILEDLYLRLDKEGDYIIFIDDANRLVTLDQILGYYKSQRSGQLKIVLTVRDYAIESIANRLVGYGAKKLFLQKFSDEQIEGILASDSFKIFDRNAYRIINQIANGNPRIAIMIAKLALEKMNISALYDITEVFETYFGTFINDDGKFGNKNLIKCMGIISFFQLIPYKDRELTEQILNKFQIPYEDFVTSCVDLESMELVEIKYDYVKVTEQNIGSFFFNKVFLNEKTLSFEVLLYNFFQSNQAKFRDSVIPSANYFNYQKVKDAIRPHLISFWSEIKLKKEIATNFLDIFWFFMQNETLSYVHSSINSIEESPEPIETDYDKNDYLYTKSPLLKLISQFHRSMIEVNTTLGLALEYVKKKPPRFAELIHNVKRDFSFHPNDPSNEFERQRTLFQYLTDQIALNDHHSKLLFLHVCTEFLNQEQTIFQSYGRRMSWGQFRVPPNEAIKELRIIIWKTILTLTDEFPKKCFEIFESHKTRSISSNIELLHIDAPFLIEYMQQKLNADELSHCILVHNKVKLLRAEFESTLGLADNFTNEIYELYLVLDWNRLRNKESFDFDNYSEFEELKEKQIRKTIVLLSKSQVTKFVEDIGVVMEFIDQHSLYRSLNTILDEHLEQNEEIGLVFFEALITSKSDLRFIPTFAFRNNLNNDNKKNEIWKIIQRSSFTQKFQTQLSYFDYLDDSLIEERHVNEILQCFRDAEESSYVHFDRLVRYTTFDSDIVKKILEIILERNEKENTNFQVWTDFYVTFLDHIKDDLNLLKKSYVQQYKIHRHLDYQGKGFLEILKLDTSILMDIVRSEFEDKKSIPHRAEPDLSVVWEHPDASTLIEKVFNVMVENKWHIAIGDNFANCFFKRLPKNENQPSDKFLLHYLSKHCQNSAKVDLIMDVISDSCKELFAEALKCFIVSGGTYDTFKDIHWRGKGVKLISGDSYAGDIRAAEWREVLEIVESTNKGIEVLQITSYIRKEIERSLQRAEDERRSRYFHEW